MQTRNSNKRKQKSEEKNELKDETVNEIKNDKNSEDDVYSSSDENDDQSPISNDSLDAKNMAEKDLKQKRIPAKESKAKPVPPKSPCRRRSTIDLRRERENSIVVEGKKTQKVESRAEVKSGINRSVHEQPLFVKYYHVIVILIPILLCFPFLKYLLYPESGDRMNITSLKEQFPKQEEKLWKAVSGGINDTLTFQHPTIYVLLYENGNEDTAKLLLEKLSKYAVCHLSNCDFSPIQLNSKVLTSPDFAGTEDYGFVVAKFKDPLEKTGVMVVEDLDEIPGKYAPAFHSFCDEISPLVRKSAFFLTIKVEKHGEKRLFDTRKVERILKDKWRNLEAEVFDPLYTRLTPMVLRILAEK